jgi:hypothetical protein
MEVLLDLAVEGIRRTDSDEGPIIAPDLRGINAADVHDRAFELYTRQTFLFKKVNAVMREAQTAVEMGQPRVDSGLWPFISILHVALLRRRGKERGRTIYRGGLISAKDLAMLEVSDRMLLIGFSSCSREETVAARFLKWASAAPPPGMVPAWFEVRLPNNVLRIGRLEVGAAASSGPRNDHEGGGSLHANPCGGRLGCDGAVFPHLRQRPGRLSNGECWQQCSRSSSSEPRDAV